MSTKDTVIQKLLAIANNFEKGGDNSKGQEIRDLISEVNAGKRDHSSIKIQAKITLEKFDGDKIPGQVPVEVQEFLEDL